MQSSVCTSPTINIKNDFQEVDPRKIYVNPLPQDLFSLCGYILNAKIIKRSFPKYKPTLFAIIEFAEQSSKEKAKKHYNLKKLGNITLTVQDAKLKRFYSQQNKKIEDTDKQTVYLPEDSKQLEPKPKKKIHPNPEVERERKEKQKTKRFHNQIAINMGKKGSSNQSRIQKYKYSPEKCYSSKERNYQKSEHPSKLKGYQKRSYCESESNSRERKFSSKRREYCERQRESYHDKKLEFLDFKKNHETKNEIKRLAYCETSSDAPRREYVIDY